MNVKKEIKEMKLSEQMTTKLINMLSNIPQDKAENLIAKLKGKSESEITAVLKTAMTPMDKKKLTEKMKNMIPQEKAELSRREEMKRQMRNMTPNQRNRKAKNFSATAKRLLGYMGSSKAGLAGAIIASIIATVCNLAAPYMLSRVLDVMQNRLMNQTTINFVRVAYLIGILGAIYVINLVFTLISSNTMTSIVQKLTCRMRKDIADKMMKLPISYFDSHSRGDVLSRMTNDIDMIGTSLQQAVTQIISYIITIIGSVILMFVVNVPLTVMCLITIPLSIVSSKIILKKSQKHIREQMKQTGQLNGIVEESFSGMNVIKAFGCEEDALDKFDKANEKMFDSAVKGQFISGTMNPVSTIFTNVAYTLICVIGAFEVISGTLTLGGITALVQYQKQYSTPLAQITNLLNSFQNAVASAERVFEILDETEESNEDEKIKLPEKIKGNIEFSHIAFGYSPDKMLMKDINFAAKPGQKVAIVGPTGAGKTTLINLLLRFYEVNGGNIYIDGINVNELTREQTRSIFGIVLQDTWLSSGTIRDNLKYANKELTDDELAEIAKKTQIDFFISAMPNSYDAEINEEAENLSQGQKQLITIARAMAANPTILILDEATSNVDTRTELMIQDAMNSLMKGRTSFVIAHRLSTIKDADLILVMKSGNIVEQGTHEVLLKENGLYAQLYNSQFERS